MNYFSDNVPLPPLLGVRIFTRPIPTTQVRVKTHRRRRIDKKWRKRYGYRSVPGGYNSNQILRIGNDFHVYPEMKEELIKAFALQYAQQTTAERMASMQLPAECIGISEPKTTATAPVHKTAEELRLLLKELRVKFPHPEDPLQNRFEVWGTSPLLPLVRIPHPKPRI